MNPALWPPSVSFAVFLAAAGIVWFAGTRLSRYADAIAEQTGIGREFLGMIMLGGITSLPEIAVATTATLQGAPVLSINDVLGSAAINILVLVLADIAVGRRALTAMLPNSGVMLQGVVGMVLLALVIVPSLSGDRTIWGMGAMSWIMLLSYCVSVRLLASARAANTWMPSDSRGSQRGDDRGRAEQRTFRHLTWRTVIAGLAILIAGFLLARTGESLAEHTGLGTSFFGAVFLGLSTSLPEMSTVLAAIQLRRYEMAISDVFGTNLFNVTVIVLVDALHPGEPILVQAGKFPAFGALLALLLTAFYLIGMLERRDRTVLRIGLDSVAVLLTYIAGVFVLYALR